TRIGGPALAARAGPTLQSCAPSFARSSSRSFLPPISWVACRSRQDSDPPRRKYRMKTDELRESYLAFFESKGCVRKPSDVLVPRGDKTVLFTPAGMNQFKNQFLGMGKLEFTRAVTCQKC